MCHTDGTVAIYGENPISLIPYFLHAEDGIVRVMFPVSPMWAASNVKVRLFTPPGGGVHGMCGYNAAKRVLKDIFRLTI